MGVNTTSYPHADRFDGCRALSVGSYKLDALELGTQTAWVAASGFFRPGEKVVLTARDERIITVNLNTS